MLNNELIIAHSGNLKIDKINDLFNDLGIKNLKNDDSYNNNEELENLARNKLGMIKQNEIIYLEK